MRRSLRSCVSAPSEPLGRVAPCDEVFHQKGRARELVFTEVVRSNEPREPAAREQRELSGDRRLPLPVNFGAQFARGILAVGHAKHGPLPPRAEDDPRLVTAVGER